jgi:hypothetical protein
MPSLRKFSVRTFILAALAAGVWAIPTAAQAAPNPPGYTGGGVWIHPAAPTAEWGFGPMTIMVKVTNPSVVNHINFTATWPGSNWHFLCHDVPVSSGKSTYTCTFNPQAAGVPALTNMTLSFDVYGTSKDQLPYNLAPNGVHYVSWGWGCIYNPPTSTCGGW